MARAPAEQDYVKTTIPKPKSVRDIINKAIQSNTLFRACSEEELVDLVGRRLRISRAKRALAVDLLSVDAHEHLALEFDGRDARLHGVALGLERLDALREPRALRQDAVCLPRWRLVLLSPARPLVQGAAREAASGI